MFNEYYRKALAKRLLDDKSASDELERSLISKLKLRCGQQFTTKLDGMVRFNAPRVAPPPPPPPAPAAPAPAARPPFHSQRALHHAGSVVLCRSPTSAWRRS